MLNGNLDPCRMENAYRAANRYQGDHPDAFGISYQLALMESGERVPEPPPDNVSDDHPLSPFDGIQSPGMCFSSGHCICPVTYGSTPTPIDGYDELWLITPEGDRILYTDPAEAGAYAETFHEFDRTIGASITWEEATQDSISVSLEADDETTVTLRASLGATVQTRLLNLLVALTPGAVVRTSLGATLITRVLARVIETNGLKIAGTTETGEPYRVEADTLRAVTSASAMVNGEDLGALVPPDRRIAFGDHVIPADPFFMFGTLYLRAPPT